MYPVKDIIPMLVKTAIKDMIVKIIVKIPLSFAADGKGLLVRFKTFSQSISISKMLFKNVIAIKIGNPIDHIEMYPN